MIAEVIPALRLPPRFSVFDYLIPDTITLAPGDVVRVPFRSGTIAGIVRTIKKETNQRQPLKSIIDVVPGIKFEVSLIEWASRAYAAPLPLVALTFIPKMPKRDSTVFNPIQTAFFPPSKQLAAINIFSTPKERLAAHRNIASKTIKTGSQVLILVSEDADLKFLSDGLRPDFPDLVTRSGSQNIGDAWKSMLAFARGQTPLMIGTRLAALTPASNLGVIILDREEDPSHKQNDAHPRYDARELAAKRAELLSIPLSVITETPSIRVFFKNPDIQLPPKKEHTIVNLKNEWKSGNPGLLSESLLKSIAETRQNGKISLLFHNRKGLGGLVVCRDCQEVVTCQSCQKAMAAEQSGLICRNCQTTKDLPLFCQNCRGPRVAIQKLGIQRLASDIKKAVSQASVAEIVRQNEGQSPPPIPSADVLLGTEVILHWYRTQLYDLPIGLVSIILADSLWHKPEYQVNENALAIINALSNLAAEKKAPLIIQTLDPDHRVLQSLTGRAREYYQAELYDRTRLGYPPAGLLVRLSNGTTLKISNDDQTRFKILSEIDPTLTVNIDS